MISLAVPAAGWVVASHPEITPPSNFHQLRDTTLYGGRGFNILEGGRGSDLLHLGPDGGRADGREGFDTVVIAGQQADFAIAMEGAMVILEDKESDAHYTLANVEHICFDDSSFVAPLSTDHIAVMRLHDMLRDQALDPMELAEWSAKIEGRDMSLSELAAVIMKEAGNDHRASHAPDFDALVTRAYHVAFGRDASAYEHNHWHSRLERADMTVSDFAAHFTQAGMAEFNSTSMLDHAFWI